MAKQVRIKVKREELHRLLNLRDDVMITQLTADESGRLHVLVDGHGLPEIGRHGVAPDLSIDSRAIYTSDPNVYYTPFKQNETETQ